MHVPKQCTNSENAAIRPVTLGVPCLRKAVHYIYLLCFRLSPRHVESSVCGWRRLPADIECRCAYTEYIGTRTDDSMWTSSFTSGRGVTNEKCLEQESTL